MFNQNRFTETLDKLSIPSYDPIASKSLPNAQNHTTNNYISTQRHMDGADVVDAVMNSPPIVQYSSDCKNTINSHNHMEPESTSEDSSLSDGDRTLVGDVSPILSTNNSPACSDQHLSSPEDHTRTNGHYTGDDDTDMLDVAPPTKNYYFKAVFCEEMTMNETEEPIRMLKVLVHNNMIIANLKRALEPFVKVPMEYFKIFRISSSQTEKECTRLNENLTSFK